MRKKFFIVIVVMFAAICFLNAVMAVAEENKCVKGYVKKSTALCGCYGNSKSCGFCCYNPETHMAYNSKNDFFIDGDGYNGREICGRECNYDGTGCKDGACNVKDCKSGYTEMKYGRCYNPTNNLSYNFDNFYLGTFQCGYKCNFDGTNCEEGFCNPKSCAKGYTEIRNSGGFHRDFGFCYNPETHLSYTWRKEFKLSNVLCGEKCNFDGTNCEVGNCNEKEIRAHGYTEIKESKSAYDPYKFYNPETHLSFSLHRYYLNDVECGYKCNFDGTNCEKGICNINDCKNDYKNLAVIKKAYFDNADIIGFSGGSYNIVACLNKPTIPTRFYDVFDKSEKTKSLVAEVPKRALAKPAAAIGTVGEIISLVFIVPIGLVLSLFN